MNYSTTDVMASYTQAVQLYDSNRLQEARELFQSIVAREPENTAALTGLGMTCWRSDAFHEARGFLDQVLRLRPADEGAIRGLCLTLLSLGELHEAEELVARAEDVDGWSHQTKLAVGLIKQGLGKWEEAACWYESAVKQAPRYAEALNNLGVARQELGDLTLARESFIEAIVANPGGVDAYRNLALLARQQGQIDEAIILLRRALRDAPDSALLWNDIGKMFQGIGDSIRAGRAFEESARLDPRSVEPVSNLSLLMYHEGYSERARALCDRLMELRPPNLGARFRKVICLPAIMESHDALFETRQRLTRELEILESARGIIHDPLREVNVSNFYLAYHGHDDRDLQTRLAELFRAKTPMLSYTAPHIGRRRAGKIKVGVCSRHWGAHTIGLLFAELFAKLSSDDFELTCFHTSARESERSPHFLARGHREIQLPLDLHRARAAISECQLDVLVYPDIGMEPFSYFLAFSRLASRQVTMWGHPLTTGIPTIDYFLSARDLEIDGADEHYSERLIRCSHLNTYYRKPLRNARFDRAYFGCKPAGSLYVCPQTLFKFHPDFDQIIADILANDPSGHLLLIEGNYRGHTELLHRRFERVIPGCMGRIRFLPRLSHEEYLGLLAIADVMLDPPHFGGGSSSLQALSFGTPIVTLPSRFLRGRITTACYKAMNTQELVARDAEHYVTIATELGLYPDKRHETRRALAERSAVLYGCDAAVAELGTFLREGYGGEG